MAGCIDTLRSYFEAAGLPEIPAWAGEVILPFPPRKYQVEDLNFLAQHTRCGLYNEMGTGKTFSMQALATWWAAQGNKVVATMPPILVKQFFKSLSKFKNLDRYVSFATFDQDVKGRDTSLAEWEKRSYPDILIMSYQMFTGKSEKAVDALQAARSKNGKAKPLSPADSFSWRTLLKKGYTALIVDEATACKHQGSGFSKAVKGFAGPINDSNGLVLATGTPVENKLEDAFNLIHLIDPKRYGSYRAFERIHCLKAQSGPDPRWTMIVGYQNHNYLWQGLYAHGRRVTKRDAMKDLPPKIFSEFEIDLYPEHAALYKQLVRERVLEIGDKVIDATQATALRQAVQQIITTPQHFTDKKIRNAVVEQLEQLMSELGDRKLLVYAWFRRSIESLKGHFQGHQPAVIYGEVTGNAREKEKERFITDPNCRMLIVQIKSGGVGVDGLQAVCSHAVFAELSPIPGAFTQACDRLHRGGQVEPVNIYLLTASKTVAVKLRNELVKRDQEQNEVVRDARTLLADLLGNEGIQGVLA